MPIYDNTGSDQITVTISSPGKSVTQTVTPTSDSVIISATVLSQLNVGVGSIQVKGIKNNPQTIAGKPMNFAAITLWTSWPIKIR